jgi:hypothetical protein
MLHIIGVAHRAQARKSRTEETQAQGIFETLLRRTIAVINPVFIAEEDSEEALSMRAEFSIAKDVADEKSIKHRFTDPTEKQRSDIGYVNLGTIQRQLENESMSNDERRSKAWAIQIACYFTIREKFWLDRLDGCRNAPAIFICGDGHVESFLELLASDNIGYQVVERGIGRDERDDEFYRGLQYLREHPQLASEWIRAQRT